MPLPQVSEWPRPRPGRAALLRDVVLGLGMAAMGVLGAELGRGLGMAPADLGLGEAEVYLWSGAVGLPLCLRRRFPATTMVIAAVLFFLAGVRFDTMIASNMATQGALFIAIYSANAWAPRRRRLLVINAFVIVGMFAWLIHGYATMDRSELPASGGDAQLSPFTSYVLLTVGINAVYFFGAVFWGGTAWRNARQRAELQRQAAELASQQQSNARRAVIDERLRISRELHDVVAHHISSIGVQAGGARRVLDQDPEASKAALTVIEASSRQAVSEMRQLLGMLRAADPDRQEEHGPAPDRSPRAGIERLADLIAEAGGEQLSVGFRRIGTPVAASRLPDTVSVSVYRIVQEALTNVRRHSTARSAQVTLRYIGEAAEDVSAVEVEVIDDGRPKHGPAGSRLGHLGIRERVALLGGEAEIGPRPVGGFRVRARFPLPKALAAGSAGSAEDVVDAPDAEQARRGRS